MRVSCGVKQFCDSRTDHVLMSSKRVRFEIYVLLLIHHIAVVISATALYTNRISLPSAAPLIVLGVFFLLSRVGGDVGFHRHFSHRSFDTHPIISFSLLLIGSAESKGSSLTWCAHHVMHHAHADTPTDPHSPRYTKPFRVLVGTWREFQPDVRTLRHLLITPIHRWMHRWYFGYNLAILICVFLWTGIAAGMLFSLPVLMSFYIGGFVNIFGHRPHFLSYRTFDTPDSSQNSPLLHALSMGGGLHNNHHHAPQLPTTQSKWYELDIPYALIKLIRRRRSS